SRHWHWTPWRGRLRTNARVALEVPDRCTCIDEETRKRCFEPFFSTKGQRGTGLCLAMVYGVMLRHDGVIEIESELGKGATFRLVFPVREGPRTDILESPVAADPLPPLRILFVDDEPLLRELLKEVLGDDGHSVELASGGQA